MSYGVGLLGNRAHQMSYGPILEARPDCRIVAAAEHRADKAGPLEERFGVVCGPDYNAVLEDPDVQIVSIATDFYLKRPLITKAIACGKHVLVDKPLSRTVREAREISGAAEGSGIRIVLSYPIRYLPGLAALARGIRTGAYANISSYTHHFVRQFKDSDLMQYVSYPTPVNVNGGGELMNLGSHAVDYLHHLFGMPGRIFSSMRNAYWDEYQAFGTEDMATVVCEYGDFVATLVTGRNKLEEEGPPANAVDVTAQGHWIHAEPESMLVNGVSLDLPASPVQYSDACVQELIDSIEEDRDPVMSVSDGLAVAEMTTAAYQSAQTGEFVTLPLENVNHPLIDADVQVIEGFLD
ncbi:MAG: Gfo/Idh/MocA family oxidoreductase [Gemmatimonadota bacterium]|nr:Gfo/Idh/MocA family oxidoreductase [Gemmatimonadota bacterium]